MEASKTLVIENYQRMVGQTFWNGRFQCSQAYESEVNYRFQFTDNESPSVRVIWIEVGKFAKWDMADQKWYYRIQDNRHFVSADYFTFDNAIKAFGERLKEYM
jgi:hypothetical protein